MNLSLDQASCQNFEVSARKEWLLTNGIGGYAMGTVAGVLARRYHGHLIAALDPPGRRTLLLAAVEAELVIGTHTTGISTNQYPGAVYPQGYLHLESFTVGNVAEWTFRAKGHTVVKRLWLVPGENQVVVEYQNAGDHPLGLRLQPLITFRDHHGESGFDASFARRVSFDADETLIATETPYKIWHPDAERVEFNAWYYRFEMSRESERGLTDHQDLFCPCSLTYHLAAGETCRIVVGTGEKANAGPAPKWPADPTFVDAIGESLRHFCVQTPERSAIMAGYPWFMDWGRDTMIALPGACLHTGRLDIAKRILRDYASVEKDGLIPNRFPEVGERPDYNTADATLWFANAVYKTLLRSWDRELAGEMLGVLHRIYRHHVKGTHFGIHVDPTDGLLSQGTDGSNLTWMDAKIGDWVATPRHGKPVEINGLWINFLRATQWISDRLGMDAENSAEQGIYAQAADTAQASFDRRFWHAGRGHYLDTVDPADGSLRPNQVIALCLPLFRANVQHAQLALQAVSKHLLTPVGLRTLGPDEPGYTGRFEGNMGARDAAYHQGTVWPWLLGPYITALVRYTGGVREAKRILRGTKAMFSEQGLGGFSEVYDGDSPHRPGGCPWQAWSHAEIFRAWKEDVGG
jgi:glycogen debranching enzyme